MALDIKEDCEVVAEALGDGFSQGRDLFIREIIPVRGRRRALWERQKTKV